MIRTVDVRFDVIRGGGCYSQLLPVPGPAPNLRMDDSGAIKMMLSGDFAYNAGFDPLTDELQPILIIDGEEHKLGKYLPAAVQEHDDDGFHYLHIEAYDRCWRVRDTYTETMPYFVRNTQYMTAIKQQLTAAGIDTVLETPSTATFPEGRMDWDIGTSRLDIANQLLAEINYNPLWFSPDGAAVLEPALPPTADRIEHILDDTDIESLLIRQMSRESDIYSAPNVFLCVCSNPDKSGPMRALAENSNPQSPLSTMRRGRRIMKVVHVDNILSNVELSRYAKRLVAESMISGERIEVSTALFPDYGVGDVVALTYGDFSALCVCKAWSMELQTGGTMRLTLERVVYNID